jgi:hypothetical protein
LISIKFERDPETRNLRVRACRHSEPFFAETKEAAHRGGLRLSCAVQRDQDCRNHLTFSSRALAMPKRKVLGP